MFTFIFYLDVQTFRWSDEAVRNLIRVWGDVYGKNKEKSPKMLLHKGFAGRRRCKEISKTLCELGMRVTASQCRYRIFQLIKQFRKVIQWLNRLNLVVRFEDCIEATCFLLTYLKVECRLSGLTNT